MAPIPYRMRRFGERLATDVGDPTRVMSESPRQASGSLRVEIKADEVDGQIARELVSMALFDAGAQAVGDDDDVLVAGFASVADAETACTAIEQAHGDLIASATTRAIVDSAWVEAQRAGLQPTQIGPWHVRAPWDQQLAIDPRFDIVIDPGAAFGHGSHPTTRLVIELMLRHLNSDNASTTTVVDLGTGTGVAAIIAARLGASVRAVEHDADAADVAWANIEGNSLPPLDDTQDRIELFLGDAAEAQVDEDDLVVANVTIDVQRLIASKRQQAHRVIVSGVLCRQVRAMQDLYPAHSASTIRTSGEWAGIEFLSNAARSRKNM